TMRPTQITTTEAPAFGHLAQATTANGTCYLGGVVGMKDGDIIEGPAQMAQAFDNLRAVLKACGSCPRNICSINILLSPTCTEEEKTAFNAEWTKLLDGMEDGYRPARACWTASLQPGFLIEMVNCVALQE
ncbi:YjgF/YER057c/UK114 family protein, partial [Kipferlia bialata]